MKMTAPMAAKAAAATPLPAAAVVPLSPSTFDFSPNAAAPAVVPAAAFVDPFATDLGSEFDVFGK